MSIQHVSADAGIDWVKQAVACVRRWPAVFLGMGFIIAVLGMIPWIGGLISLFLGPALVAGTVAAAHTGDRGGAPSIGQVFQAFQQGERVPTLVAMCIPVIVVALIAGILLAIFAAGAVMSGKVMPTSAGLDSFTSLFAALGFTLIVLIPVLLVLLFVAYAYTFFAIPRAMIDGLEAFPAMRESFAAARANLGAFLVASITLTVGMWIVAGVLHLLQLHWAADLVAGMLLYSVLGSTLYFGAKAVYGDFAAADTSLPSAPATPTPPVAPTPPVPPAAA